MPKWQIDYWKYLPMDYNVFMLLKQLRNKYQITQKEAANLIGIPYRTFVRYEENEPLHNSYKYAKMLNDLENALRIDEDHGILSISTIKSLLLPILDKHNIKYCYLFGSYSRNEAKDNSDVDLLIDTQISGIQFLELVEEIRTTLCKKIDLLRLKDLKSDNPIVLEILKEGIRLKWLSNQYID